MRAFSEGSPTAGADRDQSLAGVRVLVVTSGHTVDDSRVYARHARGLQRVGATVTVVGLPGSGTANGVTIVPVPRPSSRLVRFLWQPWRSLWAARSVPADIVHVHDAEMLVTLPIARLGWIGSRFVYDVHEDFANLLLVRDWLPPWARSPARFLTETLEKLLALLADAVVSVTEPLAEKFWNRRRVVAHNYISREFFETARSVSEPPARREFDLVHLGTLSQSRAVFLAETIRHFHQLAPQARSLVIGVPPEIEQIMRPHLPDRCLLMRPRAYTEVPGLLGKAKVGVNVHPWLQPHLAVALPVKVCEYMAAGCAVVSSTMPVLTRVLADAGVDSSMLTLIEGGEPIDYARGIVRWVDGIARGDDPGARLRELATTSMTWEGELDKIARLYLQLLKRPCAT
jgi:glycosyltransferase involved in cell wall biosynthesis